jgi:hypothetical protein
LAFNGLHGVISQRRELIKSIYNPTNSSFNDAHELFVYSLKVHTISQDCIYTCIYIPREFKI